MCGREFAERCQEQQPDLRVLFMTGHLLERIRAIFDAPSGTSTPATSR